MVYTNDIWPWGWDKWRCDRTRWLLTNIQSQFNNDFIEYAFIVNLASIRTFKCYNVAWFMVYETKDIRLKLLLRSTPSPWWSSFLNPINSTNAFSLQENFDNDDKCNDSSTDEILEVAVTYFHSQYYFPFFLSF